MKILITDLILVGVLKIKFIEQPQRALKLLSTIVSQMKKKAKKNINVYNQ